MCTSWRLTALIPAILTLVLPGAIGGGGPTLGPAQKIKQWGYSIRIIEEWNSISPTPEEKFCVGKWKPDLTKLLKRGASEAAYSGQVCELQVIRISTKTGSTKTPEEETADKKKEEEQKKTTRAILGRDTDKLLNPKSIDDYLEGLFPDAAKRWSKKEVKAGKLTGDLLEFGSGAEALCIGVFHTEGIDWAVVYTAFEEDYKKTWAELYVKSIQSFTLFEPEKKPDTQPAADLSKLKGDDKRKAIKAGIAGNPGWYAVDSKSYVFLSNGKDKGFIQQLSREIETMRSKVYEKLFPPRQTEESLSIARVLDTEEEYYQYGGPRGSAGYFNSRNGELVLFTQFQDQSKKNSKALCRSVMYHEAFHQYIHYAVGDVSPHSWFGEGHGDYFAGAAVSGQGVRFDLFEWRVSFLKDHLRAKKDLIPIRSLVRLPQSEYYTNGLLKYSEGWAFIYFLRSVTKNKAYEAVLDSYFTYLADNVAAFKAKKKEEGKVDPEIPGLPPGTMIDFEDVQKVEKILSEAVDKAFGNVDMDKLEKEFFAWVQTL